MSTPHSETKKRNLVKLDVFSLCTIASSTVEVPTAHILLMIELWQEVFRQRI